MKKRVLITSIYSGNAIKEAIIRLSPTDIILVFEDDPPTTKQEAIKTLKKFFSESISFSELKLNSLYDISDITKKIVEKIDSLKEENIFIHISEGRKTLSFAMSFAAYLRKDNIEGLYYVMEENNHLLKMPLLKMFQLNETEEIILKELVKNKKSINELLGKITKEKSRSVFYKYLKELQKESCIIIQDDLVEITPFGKMALIK
jgi:CRISPR locus-related DNA-binding protein